MSSTAPTKTSTKGRKASSTTTATASPAVAAPAVTVPVVVAASPAVVETASTTTTVAAVTDNVNVVEQFNKLVGDVSTLRNTLSTVFSEMKKLEKQIPRELKRAQKRRGRKAVVTEGGVEVPKRESVFTKPTQISDALCTFLGVAKGTNVSRSEVTARVCAYAKEKGLMEKQNIKADATLRKLLALTEADELKILNLQRYLKPHYIKPAVAASPASK